jgi:Holliday junction resolvase
MVNRYIRGRIAEKKVANRLKNKGYITRRSKGSRGPYDVYARRGKTKLYIQVKTGKATMKKPEVRKLRNVAKKRGGKAMYMKYNKGKIRSRFI